MANKVFTDGDDGVRLILKVSKKELAETKSGGREPVHVVYGGADRYTAETPHKLGSIALATFDEYAPDAATFAALFGFDLSKSSSEQQKLLNEVFNMVAEKLRIEPVEDFRIDFEDGYGFRSDEEEDADAERTAKELALALEKDIITPFSGIRIKSFAPETYRRSIRTLNIFLSTFLKSTKNKLPNDLVVTLPKITNRKEVKEISKRLAKIEKKAGLARNAIGLEIITETPEAYIDKKGRIPLRQFAKAGKGRITSAHFGAYDYTSFLGISANYQDIHHDSCKFARQLMLAAFTPLGFRVSDSVTTLMPVAIHRDKRLTNLQKQQNDVAIKQGLQVHFENVTRSMSEGFYQSWDLHPNQLIARYAAVFHFYRSALPHNLARLNNFLQRSTQASLTGNSFDDAASANGLMNFFRRGLACGAFTPDEIENAAGISADDIKDLSFAAISAKLRK